jgi:hypothetical protein
VSDLPIGCGAETRARLIQAWNELSQLCEDGPVFVLAPDTLPDGTHWLHQAVRMLSLEQAHRRANQYWSCTQSDDYAPGSVNKSLLELLARLDIRPRLPFFYVNFPKIGDVGVGQSSFALIAKSIDRCRIAIWTTKVLARIDRRRNVARRVGEAIASSGFDSLVDVAAHHDLISERSFAAIERGNTFDEITHAVAEIVERAGRDESAEAKAERQAAALARECVRFIDEISPIAGKADRIEIGAEGEPAFNDQQLPLIIGIEALETQGAECGEFLKAIVETCSSKPLPVLVLVGSASHQTARECVEDDLHTAGRTQRRLERRVVSLWDFADDPAETTDQSLVEDADALLKAAGGVIASTDDAVKRQCAPTLIGTALQVRRELLRNPRAGENPHLRYARFLLAGAIIMMCPYVPMHVFEKVLLLEELEGEIVPHIASFLATEPANPLLEAATGFEITRLELLSDIYSDIYDFEGLRRLFQAGGPFDRVADACLQAGLDLWPLWIMAEGYLFDVARLRPAAAEGAERRLRRLADRVAEGDPLIRESIRLKLLMCEGLAAFHLGRPEDAARIFRAVDDGYEHAPPGMREGDEPGGARHNMAKRLVAQCENRLADSRAELESGGAIREAWRLIKTLWGSH